MNPPDLIGLAGDWDDYIQAIYERYLLDLVHNPKTLDGRPIRVRYNPATKGKHFNFWHIVSDGKTEDEREIDLRRCERIAWIGWMIERANAGDPDLRVWNNSRTLERGTANRRLLLCEENKYVVVFDERPNVFFLTTAYPAWPRRVANLLDEWKASQK